MNEVINTIRDVIIGTSFEHNSYIAGGYVRDMIMQRESKDIDIVVCNNGLEGGISLANFLHEKLNTTKPVIFERFGTAQIVFNGIDIEFVAARKEEYDFESRKPVVSAGSIEDDVMRRDFTINALLYDISNDKVVDLVGGIKAIERGIIKTTGDPNVIFAEDPLRIMRAIRFQGQFGFKIEKYTKRQITHHINWLDKISKERIRDEFNKILMSDNVLASLEVLKESKILEYMIPEFKQLYDIKKQGKHHVKDAWGHTLDVICKVPHTLQHRLAALLHDIGKGKTMTVDGDDVHFYQHQFVSKSIAYRFMTTYKYSKDQIDLVCKSIELHMNFVDGMLNKTVRRIVNEISKDTFEFCLDLAEADSKRAERRKVVTDIRKFVNSDKFIVEKPPALPVNGHMIMKEFGLEPGKAVGELLKLEQEWIYENPELTVEEIIEKFRMEI